MRILLVLLSMIRSYPAIATGYAGTLVPRVVRSGIFHRQISSHVRQISPDKSVNFHYATAAFLVASGDYPTCLRQASLLNPGLRYVVPTYPETGPYMPFLTVGS